jgi:hypothetical protein
VLKGKQSDADIKGLLPYLSAYIRQANERGEKVALDKDEWRNFAVAHQQTPFTTRVRKLLEVLAARSKPGYSIDFNHDYDFPLADIGSRQELAFILDHLYALGYMSLLSKQNWSLTPKAWEHLESTVGIFRRCFVAMSFAPELQEAYDNGIYFAVKQDCKMEPVRIDRVHHNENICDKIIAEIRTCQFLVADVTLQRAGVYFEAGFAMGLGRPVIWSCRHDDLEKVHFDTRQYNHIVWKEPADLREQLADRIKATIPGAA